MTPGQGQAAQGERFCLRRANPFLGQEAVSEPLLVDALWRLYPRVLDRDLLSRVRVEAQLLRANTNP